MYVYIGVHVHGWSIKFLHNDVIAKLILIKVSDP